MRSNDHVLAIAACAVIAGCTHTPPQTAPRVNPRAERRLVSDLDRIFTAPAMEHGLWGVEVKSLGTGRVLYRHNSRTLMMPASNMKILTLTAAAETLGWDYRFTTTLEASAPVEGGVLEGDLFVRGTGDPSINSRDGRADTLFDAWAAALREAGITRIDGNVVADATAFDSRGLGQGWSWDYLQDGYAAPVSALEYNENVATLTITPGAAAGDQAKLELPPSTGLALLHDVTTGEPGTPTAIAIGRGAGEKSLEVTGSIAAGAAPATRDVAVANPPLYFAHALTTGLIARGIAVRGLPAVAGGGRQGPEHAPPRRVLVESKSPPLAAIATTMMKVSQNLYAETLLKTMGMTRAGVGTADAGRAAVHDVFTRWGIAPDVYVEADGSGLSRYDFVTAGMITTLLEHMYRDPKHHDAFLATLPIAGKDGTIASRMKETRADGNALGKTGSISNVRALSGFVRTRDGDTLVYSILANNFTVPAATVNWMADAAVARLADYRR
jgi:D-alanyl-D-alanine carboxypeptidase/D-alanyl-D-alanine-endopeptidase (penicillin-binding protein 4)